MPSESGSQEVAELKIGAQVSVTLNRHLPLSRNCKLAASIMWSVGGFFWIVIIFQLEFECPLGGRAVLTPVSHHFLLLYKV